MNTFVDVILVSSRKFRDDTKIIYVDYGRQNGVVTITNGNGVKMETRWRYFKR